MTANRAYRTALSSAEAQQVIRENLDAQFDLKIGATFLAMFEEQDLEAYLATV
jgi:HD-GYP domain-containing protein (c-di-GMP phosphodiesterase class II)